MKRIAMAVAFVVVAAGWTTAQDAKKALADLQGEYSFKEGSKGGKAVSDEEKKKFEKLVVKDEQIIVIESGKEDPAKFKIDPAQTPAHIDLTPTDANFTIKGIYKLEKGELTMVFALGDARPKTFEGKGENEMKLVVVKKDAK